MLESFFRWNGVSFHRKMSENNIATFQNFITACETYRQFTDEYRELNPAEQELRAFCEFVIKERPMEHVGEQFNILVHSKKEHLIPGVIVVENKINKPGNIFKTDNGAVIQIPGEQRMYKFVFGTLVRSCVGKVPEFKRSPTKKDPMVVMLYICVLISKVILRVVSDSESLTMPEKTAICQNTKKDINLDRPYSTTQFEHLRNFVGALAEHETVKKYVDGLAGEGMSEKASQVVKNFDITTLTSQNNTQKVMDAVSKADVNGFVGHIKQTLATVASNIHESADVSDPNEQC